METRSLKQTVSKFCALVKIDNRPIHRMGKIKSASSSEPLKTFALKVKFFVIWNCFFLKWVRMEFIWFDYIGAWIFECFPFPRLRISILKKKIIKKCRNAVKLDIVNKPTVGNIFALQTLNFTIRHLFLITLKQIKKWIIIGGRKRKRGWQKIVSESLTALSLRRQLQKKPLAKSQAMDTHPSFKKRTCESVAGSFPVSPPPFQNYEFYICITFYYG